MSEFEVESSAGIHKRQVKPNAARIISSKVSVVTPTKVGLPKRYSLWGRIVSLFLINSAQATEAQQPLLSKSLKME